MVIIPILWKGKPRFEKDNFLGNYPVNDRAEISIHMCQITEHMISVIH